jgi:phosphoribulokinase
VVRRRTGGKHRFDFRVFDEAQVAQKKVTIKDWTTFDEHSDLMLYEVWMAKEER